MTTLSTSDWIAISCTGIQVVAAVALCTWQIRASKQSGSHEGKQPVSNARSVLVWFLKNTWMFLFGLLVSSYLLWSEVSSSEPVVRSTLLVFAALSSWFLFNLVFLSGYAVAAVVKGKFNGLRRLAQDA